MSFADSPVVSIPLSNPVEKYGKTFRVSNIYLTSSSRPGTFYNLPDNYTAVSVFEQEFENRTVKLKWDLIDPRNNFNYSDGAQIKRNPYISGFEVSIYENTGDYTGINVVRHRKHIFTQTQIFGNEFEYTLSGASGRNYSFDVVFRDFAGNQSSGLLVSRNPPPKPILISTGTSAYDERFICSYTGGGADFIGLRLYNFTGLTSGTSGILSQHQAYLSQAKRISDGSIEGASIELEPGTISYVAALPIDKYGTGKLFGFFDPRPTVTGSGFTGLSGNAEKGMAISNFPDMGIPTGSRISGGDGIYFSFLPLYNTGSSLIYSCYKVHGTGKITGAVGGYDGELLVDAGTYGVGSGGSQYFYDNRGVGNEDDTGGSYQYTYDNSLGWQSGFHTGVTMHIPIVTGSGFTGSGYVGSGAGYYWESGYPAYDCDIVPMSPSGTSGEKFGPTGGDYIYGYFDPVEEKFGCASAFEITGGYGKDIGGIYSMPKNDPNSHKIYFRSGSNFMGTYEKAASYLNSMGEMPAVVINKTQLNQLLSGENNPLQARGWVGLRRKKVGVLTGLFQSDSANQNYFETTDFGTQTSRNIEIISNLGEPQNSRLEINDVGEYWAWVNGSGSEIYRYAGSGYYKLRQADLDIQIKNYEDKLLTGETLTGIVPVMKISSMEIERGEKRFSFNYSFEESFLNLEEKNSDFNISQINLYTGSTSGFQIGKESLAQQYGPEFPITIGSGMNSLEINLTGAQEGITYIFPDEKSDPAPFYKLLPFDTVGSGEVANVNLLIEGDATKPIKVLATNQATVFNLDEAFNSQENFAEVSFRYEHTQKPVVTYTLSYTGAGNNMGYLGAMMRGEPTISGADFVFTSAPPGVDYALYIQSYSDP